MATILSSLTVHPAAAGAATVNLEDISALGMHVTFPAADLAADAWQKIEIDLVEGRLYINDTEVISVSPRSWSTTPVTTR